MNPAYRVAIHEASHAVVAHALGARVFLLLADRTEGACWTVETTNNSTEAAIGLAGSIGESMYSPDGIGRQSDKDASIFGCLGLLL